MRRNTGVDLLRILAMLMICGYHILEHGGVMELAQPESAVYMPAWLMFAVCSSGVNIFAMLTGYLSVQKPVKLVSAAMHWLQVVFYTASITLAARIFWPGSVGKQELLNALCPITFQQYWYVTAYFGLLAFMPVIACAVRSLSCRALAGCTAAVLLLLSVQQTVHQYDIYGVNHGYSTLWLMAMALTGGFYARIEDRVPKNSGVWSFIFAGLCYMAAWLMKLYADAAGGMLDVHPTLLMRYTSPAMVLSAFSLLAAMSRIRIGNDRAARIVGALAQASFGVYLIHDHPLIRTHMMKDSFVFLGGLHPAAVILAVCLFAAAIYMVCTGVELLRGRLFAVLHIKGAAQRVQMYCLCWMDGRNSGK